jgi:hypothetical protein
MSHKILGSMGADLAAGRRGGPRATNALPEVKHVGAKGMTMKSATQCSSRRASSQIHNILPRAVGANGKFSGFPDNFLPQILRSASSKTFA